MTIKEKQREEKIAKLMKTLDCTREEAIDVIETDEIIDKGGRTKYDLPIEQEKEIRKIYAVKDRMAKDQSTNKRGKTVKENPTKESVIAEIAQFLTEKSENAIKNVEIVNKSKLITFQIDDKTFKLDLIEQRKK